MNVISIRKDVLSGIPVFKGTRVPVKNLFDYLEAGHSLEKFLDEFPTVKRKQAVAALEMAERILTSPLSDENSHRRVPAKKSKK